MTRPAETIRIEMQHLRREIADDMNEVVESARQMTDWRSYVKRYPLVCIVATAVVGFMIVPKRIELVSPDVDTLLQLAKRNKLVVKTNAKAEARSGLSGTILSLVGGAVLRAGIALAGQHLGKVMGEVPSSTGEGTA